jgi:hypothetical protein
MITTKNQAQALPTFLMTQMIEVAFDTLEDTDFSTSIARSYLAQELAKAISGQGINKSLEDNIQSLLKIQETPHAA